MASIFGHSVVGYTVAKISDNKHIKWLLLAAIFSTILPDFDVIGFKLAIPYSHPLGHRGFTHSIFFALLWALLLTYTLGKKNKKLWFFVIFLSTFSHGVLDAMTTGGRGVGFFIPFDDGRFFLPYRMIKVSPIGINKFFSEWGLQVIVSEFKFVVLPCFIILAIRFLLRRKRAKGF